MADLVISRPRNSVLIVLAIVSLIAGCTSLGGGPAPGGESAGPAAEDGQLEVLYPRIREEGSDLVLSLTIRNSHEESIDGIRVLYRVLTSRATDGIEIARVQREFPTLVAAGDVTVVEFPLPNEARSRSAGATIKAYAATRGGQPVAWPPLWTTGEVPAPANQ